MKEKETEFNFFPNKKNKKNFLSPINLVPFVSCPLLIAIGLYCIVGKIQISYEKSQIQYTQALNHAQQEVEQQAQINKKRQLQAQYYALKVIEKLSKENTQSLSSDLSEKAYIQYENQIKMGYIKNVSSDPQKFNDYTIKILDNKSVPTGYLISLAYSKSNPPNSIKDLMVVDLLIKSSKATGNWYVDDINWTKK